MSNFLTAEEQGLAAAFLADGCLNLPAEDRAALDRIRDHAAAFAARHLGLPAPNNPQNFLDTIHERVTPDALNTLRLAVFDGLNGMDWARPAYFATARRTIETIVGNELVMQLRLNLSIQLPDDEGSLLPLHADVLNGDSPFEVVLWIPLVDCRKTKSMFLLPPAAHARYHDRMAEFGSTEKLYQAVEPELKFIDIPYGNVLLFSQNLMHGNRVNRERETRWSMNCRFKGAFTPYADKRLGEFFEPISLRPATRLGSAYRLPGGFAE
ncbi:MAG TPA: sporadic carbohydrate cluster 2OG-Fe(II) oxygenase [Stellaceae bacterium]|nr:sporadic carbohydrate cluster 2OG-Fe(II) oxygenase [Stellaceae bacterium]